MVIRVIQIPSGFKSVAWPCDADVIRPLRTKYVKLSQD